MRASRRKIAETIASKLETVKSPSRLAKEVAAYLLSEGRTSELEPIMRDVIELRASRGLVEATVTSAYPLPQKAVNEASKLVSKIHPKPKKLTLNEAVNKDLIGGLKLNVVNNQLDLSIRAKLNRFKQLTNQRGA